MVAQLREPQNSLTVLRAGRWPDTTPARVDSMGRITLSRELSQRFAGRRFLRPVDIGPDRFGLIGTDGPRPGLRVLKISHLTGGTIAVSGRGILSAMGRAIPVATRMLEHSWDGPMLVLSVAALDTAEVL